MPAENPLPPAFDLCGGHPALDFVNTLDDRFGTGGPVERLVDYGQLLRFSAQSSLLSPRAQRALVKSVTAADGMRALRAAQELREALAAIFYARAEGRAPGASELRTLEKLAHDAGRYRELRWLESVPADDAGARARWEWGRYETEAELPVWMLALAASQLVTSEALAQVRACGSDTCRWLFLDTSKNHTRRWCKMEVCGNRVKARRFQARRARHKRARRVSA